MSGLQTASFERARNVGPEVGDRVPRGRAILLGGLLGAVLLIAPVPGRIQPAGWAKPNGPLAGLRIGQWIELAGTLRGDDPALCRELRLLAGDFLDHEWALRGTVASVDLARRTFTVGGLVVRVNENTRFESRTLRRLSDLRVGMQVDVEGTYRQDRRFLAVEIDDEADEMGRSPMGRNHIQLVGRVERVDSRRGLVAAMGTLFHVTAATRLRSAID